MPEKRLQAQLSSLWLLQGVVQGTGELLCPTEAGSVLSTAWLWSSLVNNSFYAAHLGEGLLPLLATCLLNKAQRKLVLRAAVREGKAQQ